MLDALKHVFPITKRYKAASQLSITLDSLFIDAQLEWENVFSGVYADAQINTRVHKLRKLQLEAESRNFPEGLKKDDAFFEQAQSDARAFFATTYTYNPTWEGSYATAKSAEWSLVRDSPCNRARSDACRSRCSSAAAPDSVDTSAVTVGRPHAGIKRFMPRVRHG